ncbi:hypothetical protein [Maridesulfovibrio sp.]|uniref:hypothetical protein n=1 Tax=Maridesulfovibrio sp. TaxID=2795000 RepID=UPI002A18C431|nr:hypothetical protein [Maridesulfovibrio sp.]
MSNIKVKRIKRSWKDFFKNPIFGKTVWTTDNEGVRHYTRAEAYELPYWPEPLVKLVEIHEQGHLDGLQGQSWPLDVMFEAPGKLADTIWEKLMMVVVGPVVLLRRFFTGSWFCKANQKLLAKNAA